MVTGNNKKEEGMKRFSLLMIVVIFLMISTLGCNAARGVGKDIQDTGKHVSNIGN